MTLHRKPFMYTTNTMSDDQLMDLRNWLTLSRTVVDGVDPVPSTDTAVIGAGRHVLGNLEQGIDYLNTLVVDAENCQILGLDAIHVRSVCNGKGATPQVINALKGNKLVSRWSTEIARTPTLAKIKSPSRVNRGKKGKIKKRTLLHQGT